MRMASLSFLRRSRKRVYAHCRLRYVKARRCVYNGHKFRVQLAAQWTVYRDPEAARARWKKKKHERKERNPPPRREREREKGRGARAIVVRNNDAVVSRQGRNEDASRRGEKRSRDRERWEGRLVVVRGRENGDRMKDDSHPLRVSFGPENLCYAALYSLQHFTIGRIVQPMMTRHKVHKRPSV